MMDSRDINDWQNSIDYNFVLKKLRENWRKKELFCHRYHYHNSFVQFTEIYPGFYFINCHYNW